MSGSSKPAGHAFISYVREDSDRVDRLQRTLEAAGIPVWRDTANLWPGEDWRANIRRAITDDALAFVACFSRRSLDRDRSYQNEELLLAIEQLRLRRPDDPWLIPVRFDDCEIPVRDLGGGRTLTSIQRVDLFGDKFNEAAARLVAAIRRILDRTPRAVAGILTGPAPSRRARVNVTIAEPDSTDAGFHQPVCSVVYVEADDPISDLTVCYVTDQSLGGTTSLGYAPFHISTRVWRIRSEFLLRSIRDVIIGYTTVAAGHKVQWFQWDGYDHEYDWSARGADGSHLSALHQIREVTLSGEGAQTQPVRRRVTPMDPMADDASNAAQLLDRMGADWTLSMLKAKDPGIGGHYLLELLDTNPDMVKTILRQMDAAWVTSMLEALDPGVASSLIDLMFWG